MNVTNKATVIDYNILCNWTHWLINNDLSISIIILYTQLNWTKEHIKYYEKNVNNDIFFTSFVRHLVLTIAVLN